MCLNVLFSFDSFYLLLSSKTDFPKQSQIYVSVLHFECVLKDNRELPYQDMVAVAA